MTSVKRSFNTPPRSHDLHNHFSRPYLLRVPPVPKGAIGCRENLLTHGLQETFKIQIIAGTLRVFLNRLFRQKFTWSLHTLLLLKVSGKEILLIKTETQVHHNHWPQAKLWTGNLWFLMYGQVQTQCQAVLKARRVQGMTGDSRVARMALNCREAILRCQRFISSQCETCLQHFPQEKQQAVKPPMHQKQEERLKTSPWV